MFDYRIWHYALTNNIFGIHSNYSFLPAPALAPIISILIMGAKKKYGIADIIVISVAWMIAIMLVYVAFVKLRLFLHH
jgi:hypothetical protein